VNRRRIREEKKCKDSIGAVLAINLVDGAIPAVLLLGLFVMVCMTAACAKKVVRQEAVHTEAAALPVESQHSVIAPATMIPSGLMCTGLTGDSETKCLCPNSLQFGLSSLPESPEHNFSTNIDIRRSVRPMYRIRIFSAHDLESVGGIVTIPNEGNSLNVIGRLDEDPASVTLSSSAPKDEFKLNVETAQALRLKCVNQEN